MNITPWLRHLTVLTCIFLTSQLFAMDSNIPSKQYADATVALLPLLNMQNANVVPINYVNTFQTYAQQKEYQLASVLARPNPLQFIKAVQEPIRSHREVVKNGKTVNQYSAYQFALAHLAEGYLLLQSGKDASDSFGEAIKIAGSKPQEQGVALAASFEDAFAQKLYAIAFDDVMCLKEFAQRNANFAGYKELAELQLQKLIDVSYVPAIKLKADAGSVDLQYQLLGRAALEASQQKTRDAYFEKLDAVAGYFDSLEIHPEFRPLTECVRLAYQAGLAYRAKELITCTKKLIEIVNLPKHGKEVTALQNMARLQISFAAKQGESFARCYETEEQMASSHKATRAAGVESARQLVLDAINANNEEHDTALKCFHILENLEKFASSKPSVAMACANYYCIKALSLQGDALKQDEFSNLLGQARKNARWGQQEESYKRICTCIENYAHAIDLLAKGSQDQALELLVSTFFSGKKKQHLEILLTNVVRGMVEKFAKEGNLIARCWQNQELFRSENGKITPTMSESCCKLAQDVLENATQEFLEGSYGAGLYKHVQSVANMGNSLGNYLAARMVFRIMHTKFPQGLEASDMASLVIPMTFAVGSLKYGKDAQIFTRALQTYQRIQKNITELNYDEAANDCFKLLEFELPKREKQLCHAFAQTQLEVCAHKGNVSACAWSMSRLFESANVKEQQEAVVMAIKLFSRLMNEDFDKRTQEQWQTTLEPFVRHGIVQKMEQLLERTTDKELIITIGATIADLHVIQAMTCQRLLSDNEPLTRAHQLQLALAHATALHATSLKLVKEEHQESCNQLFYPVIGRCYYLLSHLSLDCGEFDLASMLMEAGAKLLHPPCLRSNALWILDKKDMKDKIQFDICIASLEAAYELGDKVAGAVLAWHYFNGSEAPFGCGLATEKNAQRSLKLAIETCTDEFPNSMLIIGNNELAISSLSTGKDQKQHLDNALRLFLQAGKLKSVEAYSLLTALYKVDNLDVEQRILIKKFLASKEQDNDPVAMCALSNLALSDGEMVVAYHFAKQAMIVSNNHCGYLELVQIYAQYPENFIKEPVIFDVVDHSIQFLEATNHVNRDAAIDTHIFFSQILFCLASLDDLSDHAAKAKEYYTKLVAAIEKAGIKLEKVKNLQEFDEIAAEMSWFRVPGAIVDGTLIVPPVQFKMTESAQLLTNDFLQGLAYIDAAFEDMDSQKSREILSDQLVYEMLFEGSNKDNALAAFLLSKVCLYNAIEDLNDYSHCKLFLQESFQAICKACSLDENNARYASLCVKVSLEILNMSTKRFIPEMGYDLPEFNQIFKVLNSILGPDRKFGKLNSEEENNSIICAAKECLYTLACHGHVPSALLYADLYFDTKENFEQQKALEALCRNALALRRIDDVVVMQMGIGDLINKYAARVKELAVMQGNGTAALITSYWIVRESDLQNGDNPLGASELERVIALADWYFHQAALKGCSFAKYMEAKKILLGDKIIKRDEFINALGIIYDCANDEPEAIEFLMNLYSGHYGKLRCGHEVPIDMVQVKAMAELIKDTSIEAWRALARIANIEGNKVQLVLCKLEIIKRTKNLESSALLKFAKDCSDLEVFPAPVKEYLEARIREGNIYAMQALATILINRKEFDKGINLLKQAMAKATIACESYLPSLHFELAIALARVDNPNHDIERALFHVTQSLELLGDSAKKHTSLIGVLHGIGGCLIRFLEQAIGKDDTDSQEKISHVFEKLVDAMQTYELIDRDSFDHQIIMATLHCIKKSQFPFISQYLDYAAKLCRQKGLIEEALIFKSTVTIVMFYMSTELQKAQQCKNAEQIALISAQTKTLLKQIAGMDLKSAVPLVAVVKKAPKKKVVKIKKRR